MSKVKFLEDLGINLQKRNSGEIKTTCPKCSPDRKNKQDKCLSVNIDSGVYCCHHCDWKGKVFEKPKKEYVKPLQRLQKVSDKVVKWFEGRGISNNTLLRFGITESTEWMPQEQKEVNAICFNYYRNGELVNIKFRDAKKNFKLNKDSELIFYNLDAIADEKECIIVEGEMDCLTLHEAGIFNVVSVPNGASKGSQKLEYLDNCFEYFENKERIIIFTDSDEAGIALREELARRLGKERCCFVEPLNGLKDANEVFIKEGSEKLKETILGAKEWPLEGIVEIDDILDDIYRLYDVGYPEGLRLGLGEFDEYLRITGGQLTIVTGIPGSGKSEFIDEITVKTLSHEWKWAIFSFETPVNFHITKLAEKITRKAFGRRKNPYDRMSVQEFERAIVKIADYYNFVNIDEVDVTIDGIIQQAEILVKRKGIKGIVIDPWNYIEINKDRNQSETEYVSTVLTKLIKFLRRYDVHCFLIAHPTKLKKENGKYEVPTLYHISGSAHFFNKTHNGLTIYRDFETNTVDVHIQKIKNYWQGKIGTASFTYNTETRQYIPI